VATFDFLGLPTPLKNWYHKFKCCLKFDNEQKMMKDTKENSEWGVLSKQINSLKSHIHPPVPNPAPLGLFAFGFTTALLQVKHTRIGGSDETDIDGTEALVLGFAMFFGGFLQVVAGLSEIRRNNIFGYTAFLLYGGLWMSLGTVDIVQLLATDAQAPNPKASQAMLFLAGVFTFVLWICTFKLNRTLNLLFFLLTSTLFLLTGGVRNETVDKIGGWFGILTSAVAYWLAAAELINDIHGAGKKEIIPLGHFKANEFQSHGAFQAPGRIQSFSRRSLIAPVNDNESVARAASEISEMILEDVEAGVTQE
jgi:succinate-acetate transporter protein